MKNFEGLENCYYIIVGKEYQMTECMEMCT